MAAAPPNPRSEALALLDQVLEKRRPLDVALENNSSLANMPVRDRAFARLLVMTLLRRLGQLDALIDHCLARPLKDKQIGVRNLLRLGAAQLLFLGTPAHAAVSTTMLLAEHPRLAGQKGLINAVLRRLSREGPAFAAAQDAARLNTPAWLWEAWTEAYGAETTRAIAEAHQREAPLDLSVKQDPQVWADRLQAKLLPGGSLRLKGGEVTGLAGFDEGAWWVQDAAAAWPARLLAPLGGLGVLDICAAPGGKTAQLAAAGAAVTAIDRSPTRLRRLQQNLARLGLNATLVEADATQWRPAIPADAVLLDAPCSATGTLRRHPDIAQLKSPRDLVKLTDLQARLLRNALACLRPGGTLVYAVCSLQPEEGPGQIAKLLAEDMALRRAPLAAREIGGLEAAVTAEGDLRTLPCHLADEGGLDGFYACRLVRN